MTTFEKIDYYRKLRGLSGAKLVGSIGLTRSVYTQWKNGSLPKPENLPALAKVLDVSVSDLMPSDDDYELEIRERIQNDYAFRALYDASRGATPAAMLEAAAELQKKKEAQHA